MLVFVSHLVAQMWIVRGEAEMVQDMSAVHFELSDQINMGWIVIATELVANSPMPFPAARAAL